MGAKIALSLVFLRR